MSEREHAHAWDGSAQARHTLGAFALRCVRGVRVFLRDSEGEIESKRGRDKRVTEREGV